jgi:hypothetical protein
MRVLRLLVFTGSYFLISHPGRTDLNIAIRINARRTGFQKTNIRKGQHDESMA